MGASQRESQTGKHHTVIGAWPLDMRPGFCPGDTTACTIYDIEAAGDSALHCHGVAEWAGTLSGFFDLAVGRIDVLAQRAQLRQLPVQLLLQVLDVCGLGSQSLVELLVGEPQVVQNLQIAQAHALTGGQLSAEALDFLFVVFQVKPFLAIVGGAVEPRPFALAMHQTMAAHGKVLFGHTVYPRHRRYVRIELGGETFPFLARFLEQDMVMMPDAAEPGYGRVDRTTRGERRCHR